MNEALRIWAEIILEAVEREPERYPYLTHLFRVAPNPENGIKLEASHEAVDG